MSEKSRLHWAGMFLGLTALAGSAAVAEAETRSLSLYNTHTQERATIVFKRNGQFDPAGVQELSRMLRDWRRNEVTKMDPQLFDLVWQVYRESGSSQPIHIISGYRSPATNGMLRSRSRGVAKLSQHMLGKAMDFYLPDVPLDRLRAIGMKMQYGGVGFYPTSGSPFVHMDTGSVRAWPRMTREQLVRLFPDGKTAHLPSDGAPLPRYEEALAEVQQRKGSGSTALASSGSGSGRGFLAAIFGRDTKTADDDEDEGAPSPGRNLRQGPPPPGSRAIAGVEPGESYAPPPGVKPDPVTVAGAANPTVQAPGSLVALPVPTPSPRAPGSLVAAAQPGQTGTPPGWNAGPQGIAPTAGTPIAVPIPAAKPGSQPVAVASAAPLPDDFAQPRRKPGQNPSVPATEAIAILTGAPDRPQLAASVLGYAASPAPAASARAEAAPIEARPAFTTAQRPPTGGVVVAALPPAAAVTGTATADAPRPTPAPAAAAARPAAKGDRTDPLARLVGRTGDRPERRLLDTGTTTRTAAFGDLHHPDQQHLPQLLVKPAQLVVTEFGAGQGGDLRSDRFTGPAVMALAVVRTE